MWQNDRCEKGVNISSTVTQRSAETSVIAFQAGGSSAFPSLPPLQRLILVISSPLKMNGNQLVKSVAMQLGTKELEHSNSFTKLVTLVWLSSAIKPYSNHLFCVRRKYVFGFLMAAGGDKSSQFFWSLFAQDVRGVSWEARKLVGEPVVQVPTGQQWVRGSQCGQSQRTQCEEMPGVKSGQCWSRKVRGHSLRDHFLRFPSDCWTGAAAEQCMQQPIQRKFIKPGCWKKTLNERASSPGKKKKNLESAIWK